MITSRKMTQYAVYLNFRLMRVVLIIFLSLPVLC